MDEIFYRDPVMFGVDLFQSFSNVGKSIIGSNKKEAIKWLLAHINNLGANNWNEVAVEETLYILP